MQMEGQNCVAPFALAEETETQNKQFKSLTMSTDSMGWTRTPFKLTLTALLLSSMLHGSFAVFPCR